MLPLIGGLFTADGVRTIVTRHLDLGRYGVIAGHGAIVSGVALVVVGAALLAVAVGIHFLERGG